MHYTKFLEAVERAFEGWLIRDRLWVVNLFPCIPPLELYQMQGGKRIAFTKADKWELFPEEITIDFSKTSLFIVQLVHPEELCEYVARCVEKGKNPLIGKYETCPYYSLADCAFFRSGSMHYAFIFDSKRKLKAKSIIKYYPLCQALTEITLPYFQNGYESVRKIIAYGTMTIPGWIAEDILSRKICKGCPYREMWEKAQKGDNHYENQA